MIRVISGRGLIALTAAGLLGLAACSSVTNGTGVGGSPPVSPVGSFPPSSSAAPSSPAAVSTPAVPTTAPATSSLPSTPAAPSSAQASSPSADLSAKLKAIVLQPGDVPAGYSGTEDDGDPEENSENAALVRCVGGHDTSADRLAEVHSEDYSTNTATISSQAESYRTAADLAADAAILRSPKISACYEQLARSEVTQGGLPAGTTIQTVKLTVTPGTGHVVANGTGTIDFTSQGQHLVIYLNVAFIEGPLVEAEVDFEDVGAPVPASVRSALIAKVAARAAG